MKLHVVGTTADALKGDTSLIVPIVMKEKNGLRCEGFEIIQVREFLGLAFS